MIKALFFDIDGTLVSFNTYEIPQSTVDALEQAKRNLIIPLYNSLSMTSAYLPFLLILSICFAKKTSPIDADVYKRQIYNRLYKTHIALVITVVCVIRLIREQKHDAITCLLYTSICKSKSLHLMIPVYTLHDIHYLCLLYTSGCV